MSRPATDFLRRQLRKFLGNRGEEQGDVALLHRFVDLRDDAAFTALLDRHGPLVLGVCRQVLGDLHAAEDAFQATFLILARKAASIRKSASLAGWLHRVATNVARTALVWAIRRRRSEERAVAQVQPSHVEETMEREWHPALHAEVDRLPSKYRLPIVLCYLQGKTHDEAACELGSPVGTVRSSLARGRDILRQRLTRRGLTLGAGAVASTATVPSLPAVPPALAQATLQAALAGVATPAVATLAEATLTTLALAKPRTGTVAAMVLLLLGLGTGWLAWHLGRAPTDAPQPFVLEATPEAPPEPAPARRDLHGDPLPAGALVRLGAIRLRQPGELAVARFAPNNTSLATGDQEGVLRLWDMNSGKQLAMRPGHEGPIGDLVFSPDGRWLASACPDGVCLWEHATGKGLRALTGAVRSVRRLTFTPDGKVVLVVTTAGEVVRWDASTGKLLQHFPGHGRTVAAVAFSPDGQTVALGLSDQRSGINGSVPATAAATADTPTGKLDIVLKDLTTGKELRRWPAHAWMPRQLAFALDARLLISGSSSTEDPFLHFWDPATGKEVPGFPEIDCCYGSFTVTPDGKTLVSADSRSREGMVLCDLATRRKIRDFNAPGRFLSAMSVSLDGKRVVVLAERNRAVHVYSLATGEAVCRLGHQGAVARIAFTPDGNGLATLSECRPMPPVGEDATLRLWDARNGRPLEAVPDAPGILPFLAFSSDGKLVATSDPAGMWDSAAGKRVRPYKLWADKVENLHPGQAPVVMAYAPDLTRLAIGYRNGGLELRDARSGQTLGQFGMEVQAVGFRECMAVAFSPDGKMVAAARQDGSLLLWDTGRNHVVGPVEAFPYCVTSVAFSPDGRTVATTGGDGQIHLWEVLTGQPRGEIGPGPEQAREHWKKGGSPSPYDSFDRFRATAFAPNGRTLASAGIDGTVAVWDIRTGKELAQFRGHLGAVRWVAFAPDGRRLASASEDTTALVWDLADIKPAGNATPDREPSRCAELWSVLGSTDAPAAYRAVNDLIGIPAATVEFLGVRLPSVLAPDAEKVAKLIAGLRDDDFQVRERAALDLEALGEVAEPFLREALKSAESLDMRHRLERLREKAVPPLSAEMLRAIRGIEVLEQVGTPAARQVLERLAQGAEGARLTREAKSALIRLETRVQGK